MFVFISSIDWPTGNSLLSIKPRIRRCFRYYRGIYLVIQDLNLAFGTLFIPYFKLTLLLGFITSFFALVRLPSDMDVLSYLIMIVTVPGSLTLVVPIALVMSNMHSMSENFIPTLSPTIQLLDNRIDREYFGRQLRSCPLIRCKIGNMYYMESEAKLTMLDRTVATLMFLFVNVKK